MSGGPVSSDLVAHDTAGAGEADGRDARESPGVHSTPARAGWPAPASPMLHLLSMADLDAGGIAHVLRVTDSLGEVVRRSIPRVPALRGRTVVSLFAEESTRTRLSFETAARRMSADVLTFSPATSSVKKGESLRDTVETIAAMGADAFVVRHSAAGAPARVARWVDAHVVNAGDGWHEHPTQALLDCYTIRQCRAEAEGRTLGAEVGTECFVGLHVAVVGDVRHSRVARSLVIALRTLGARTTLVCPGTLAPPSLEGWGVDVSQDLDAVLPEVDVVYVLRLQLERGTGSYLPSAREYSAGFGLTVRRAARLAPGAIVMHPGPMNRGVEIADEVADMARSVVLRQVANGVAVRMAVLYLLLAGPNALEADELGRSLGVAGA